MRYNKCFDAYDGLQVLRDMLDILNPNEAELKTNVTPRALMA